MRPKSPFTLGILALNAVFFIMTMIRGGGTVSVEALESLGAQFGPRIAQGEYYRLVSAIFLHGNLLHILFNSYALYYFGQIVEYIFSPGRFLMIYFVTGVVGNILTHLFLPGVFSVGASGSVFGLVGVLFAIGIRKDHPRYLTPVTGTALLPMIVINLIFGFTVPGINNAAHLGGLATGFILGLLLKPMPPQQIEWIRFWKAVQWVIIGIVALCLGFVLFSFTPPLEMIIRYHNTYLEMLDKFQDTSTLSQFDYYINLLQPFDRDTENLKEQAIGYVESRGRNPNLDQLYRQFTLWRDQILQQYGNRLQMRGP